MPNEQGKDYYFNKEGLLVFTEAYHLKRGYCCKNECLHCPFEISKKPEGEKSKNVKRNA